MNTRNCKFHVTPALREHAAAALDTNTMNEMNIEIKVEKMTDRIDRQYMNGKLTTAEYRAQMDALNAWAERQYDRAERMAAASAALKDADQIP